MLQFNETNGTLVSGIRSCYQWLPHGKIIPKCVINQENANKPICTCYLEVRQRRGMSSLFANVTFFYFKCSLCSPVVHIFFQKLHFQWKIFDYLWFYYQRRAWNGEKNICHQAQWIENLSFNDLWQFNLINIFWNFCVPSPVLNRVGDKLTVQHSQKHSRTWLMLLNE